MNSHLLSRRSLDSLLGFAVLDLLAGQRAFASPTRTLPRHWLFDLDELARDVKSGKVGQIVWQARTEELLAKVELADLLRSIDFDTVARKAADWKGRGALGLAVNVAGVPGSFVVGQFLYAMRKGRSIVPHGHDSMATAFLVLKGRCRGRHYDRLGDEKDFMIIRPTLDKSFGPGATSSVSDVKDNVHWFEAETDATFVFNIHVSGLAGNKAEPGRIYVDPKGEKLADGKLRARLIDHEEATRLYG